MHVEYFIVLGIMPLLLIAEWLWTVIKKQPLFNFNDTIVNICCGILDRTFDVFWSVLMYAMFVYIYDNWALFHIPFNVFTWLGFFLLTDFMFYWFHRFSHEINLLWGIHETHHQSEEYNYTIPFRVSGLATIVRFFFWIPIIVLGCPPKLAISIVALHAIYQFFTHTKMINKMGFLEKILITPSIHRVHHGCNPKYIDKNYGGVLVIWDRMFGTYCPEEEEVVYGTIQPFRSTNPYWAVFHYWVESFRKARYIRRFPDKIKYFLERPGYVPEDLKPHVAEYSPEMVYNRRKPRNMLAPALRRYVVVQLIISLLFTALIVLLKNLFSWPDKALLALLIGISTYCIGRLLENRERIWSWEFFRLALTPLVVLAVFFDTPYVLPASGIAVVLSSLTSLWAVHTKKKSLLVNV